MLKRVYSLLTAICITALSLGATPKRAEAAQIFNTEQIIEAEGGTLNRTLRETDYSASGNLAVYINSGAVAKSEDISLEAMSWLVNIPKDGSYRVFVRGRFTKDTRDDFWIGTSEYDEWIKASAGVDSKYKWCEAAQIDCTKGVRKIKLQPAETDGRFDAIYITSNANDEFAPPIPEVEKIEEDEETVSTDDEFVHKQEKVLEVTGTGIQIQLGDASYTSAFTPGLDRNAADMDMLKSGVNNSVSSLPGTESPHLQVEFKTDKTASYSVWIRYYAASASSDSIFFSYGDGDYSNKSLKTGEYKWYKLHSGKIQADTVQKLRLRSRESGCCLDSMIITSLTSFTPTGRTGNLPVKVDSKVEKLNENYYENPAIYPPANEHPRVLFRKSDIPRILENMNTPQNEEARDAFLNSLSEEIDTESGAYTVANMMCIEAHAFDYAINGNRENGLKAKEGIMSFLENNPFSGQAPDAITRKAGHAIYTAAEVYDWCYDLLTPAERAQIVSECTGLAAGMEMGWPPTGQGAQTGHGAEAQLLRDFMSLAIAAYDERPDLWDFIAGRYYEQYVPTFNFWHSTQYQGSSYGAYRQMWSTWSYLLIKGMGGEIPVDLDKVADSMLWGIYYRRPDGQMLRDGDITSDTQNMWAYWTVYPQGAVNISMLTGNKYLKLDAGRTNMGIAYTSVNNEFGGQIPFLIFNDPEIQPEKNYDDLPLSKYMESPYGIMVARTGWKDGVDSPAVVARMKVGEYQTNNHQHLDAGEFQIYYKGSLAADSGVYEGFYKNKSVGGTVYGADHNNQYGTKTIAHNCMLVFDPKEGNPSSTARGIINDGGQSAISNGGEFGLSPESHVADVEGHEIDPTNTKEPNYSYLKGNLTNAYSKKISDYKRSFMFLNLKNEKVPAAMIVFDKINSTNASFKKTWLIHGLEEPTIDGNRTVFSRTYRSTIYNYGYNGKLTVDTLLPEKNTIKKVGGEDGWSNVNGVDYTGLPLNSQTDEGNTWRVEVSPANQSEEDFFLNVMQVSDNDKSEYLPVSMLESDLFYGAKISDRAVLFSKSGNRVDKGFSFEVQDNGELQYTVCDVASGTYKVTVDGNSQLAAVSEDGGVLAFKANGGKVTVEPSNEEAEAVQDMAQVKEYDNTVSIRMDKVFIYNPIPAVLQNGTVMIDADEIGRHFGVNTEKNDNTLKFTRKDGSIEFTSGANTANTNEGEVALAEAPTQNNGIWMIPARAAVVALGGKISWDGYTATAYITLPKADLSLPNGYAKIISAAGDEGAVDGDNAAPNAIDENADTIWASNGVGRYITLELEKTSTISNVEVMFNPNSARNANFAIEISEDGKKYTNIYEGTSDGSVEPGTWEKFEFDKPYSAKYIRYFGNGSNLSKWNAIQEIRFKLK